MRVVRFAAGVGNQLFMYGLYRQIIKIYGECFADLGWFDDVNREAWFPYQLEQLGLSINEISRDDYFVKEYHIDPLLLSEISEYENKIKSGKPILTLTHERNAYSFDSIWKNDDAYYVGCFQNIDNMSLVIDDIRNEVVFKENNSIPFQKFKRDILNSQSVSIQMRFNDYDAIEDFEKVCPISYYEKAINHIENKIENPLFFVFSNQIEKAKNRLKKRDNIIFVDINDRFNGLGDLELMTLCKHNIIPNSTFAWWGAVLNKNKNRIVVAPNRFNIKLKEIDNSDINLWFDDWIRIEG